MKKRRAWRKQLNEAIFLKEVSKRLNGKTVLDNISFNVSQGDIFGYLGPNGAGKTTTMRIILGLIKPNTGTVLVQGKNLAKDTAARQKIGVLLERDGLYERLSARENLFYYARLYGITNPYEKIKSVLSIMELSGRKEDKVGTFSKGMKRKLALAKAIMNDPEVLFLDEPSSGLDPEAQKIVRDLILRLCQEKNMTIFLNSHDLDEVQRICSKAAIIQKGTIRICDKMDNLTGKEKTNTVNIKMVDNMQTIKADRLLKSLTYVTRIERQGLVNISVTLQKPLKSSGLFTDLINGGIQVEEVKTATQSLEEIYLEIIHQEKENE
jgi:ABC-2 type transport system ATP-binding protein